MFSRRIKRLQDLPIAIISALPSAFALLLSRRKCNFLIIFLIFYMIDLYIINDSSYSLFSCLFYDILKKWVWPKFRVDLLKVKLLASSVVLTLTFSFISFFLVTPRLSSIILFFSSPYIFFTFFNFHGSCFLYIIPIDLLPKLISSFLSYSSSLWAHNLLNTFHSSENYLVDF